VGAIREAMVPVNMAEYPARNMEGVNGTGRTMLRVMRIQYWNTQFVKERPE
jgi:hypothetical protein